MDFEFYNPTHLVFGAGKLAQLGEVASVVSRKKFLKGVSIWPK